MENEKIIIQIASEVDPNLLRMPNNSLEDIETGRAVFPAFSYTKEQPGISARLQRKERGVYLILIFTAFDHAE